jgi:hypothetical protein
MTPGPVKDGTGPRRQWRSPIGPLATTNAETAPSEGADGIPTVTDRAGRADGDHRAPLADPPQPLAARPGFDQRPEQAVHPCSGPARARPSAEPAAPGNPRGRASTTTQAS